MRILALAILAIAMVSAAPQAHTQTYDPAYPVCLQIYQGWNDYYFECAYTSLAQCNASASGRAAQCIVNRLNHTEDFREQVAFEPELVIRESTRSIKPQMRLSDEGAVRLSRKSRNGSLVKE